MAEIIAAEIGVSYSKAIREGTDFLALNGQIVQEIGRIRDVNKALEKERKRLSKDTLLTEEQRNAELRNVTQNIAKNQSELKRLSATQRDFNKAINSTNKELSVYDQMRNRLVLVQKELKELSVQGKRAPKELQAEFKRLDSQLRKAEKSVGQFQRNVGNYRSSLKGIGSELLGAFGIVGGVSLLADGIRNSVQIVVGFEDAINKLGAISNASKDDLAALQQQAKDLGSTTAFTATEVAQLQTELAKLGFNPTQIQQSTKAIIDLSIALDTNAARAAALAGSQIRAFRLDASEAGRVAEVLGISTTKSALDVEKLENSLKQVSPAAAALGFSIEETVALIGALSNAGFRGEQAGTALRNIFLKLANPTSNLSKELGTGIDSVEKLVPALQKLRDSGGDLQKSLELTDIRAVTAFETLLSGSGTVEELTNELSGLDGELAQLANTRLDTVSGKTKLLGSAWEGLILSVEDGNGALSNAVKGFLDGTIAALGYFQAINEGRVQLFGEGGNGFIGSIFDFQENQEIEATIKRQQDSLRDRITDLNDYVNAVNRSRDNFIKFYQDAGFGVEEATQKTDDFFLSVQAGLTQTENPTKSTGKNTESIINSIKALTKRKKELEDQRSIIEINSDQYNKLTKEIQKLDKELSKTKVSNYSKQLKDQSKEAEKAAKAQQRLNEAIQGFEDKELSLLELEATKELEEYRKEIDETLEKRKQFVRESRDFGSDSFGVIDVESDDVDANQFVLDIQKQYYKDLQALRIEDFANEDAFNSAKEALRLQSEQETARLLLSEYEVGSLGYLQQLQVVADAEIAILDAKNNAILEKEQANREQRIENIQAFLQGISQIGTELGNLQDVNTQNEINALEQEYERRFELAEGNAEQTAQLEQELDDRREQIEREAFERNKKLSIAQALINGALAITAVLAAVPGPADIATLGVARIAQIAATTIATGLQVAAIAKQQFHTGGEVKRNGNKGNRVSDSSLKPDETNAKLQFGEVVLTRKAMQSNKEITIKGTPKQIASKLNSDIGKGVSFAKGASYVTPTIQYIPVAPTMPTFKLNGELYRNESNTFNAMLDNNSIERIEQAIANGTAKAIQQPKPNQFLNLHNSRKKW